MLWPHGLQSPQHHQVQRSLQQLRFAVSCWHTRGVWPGSFCLSTGMNGSRRPGSFPIHAKGSRPGQPCKGLDRHRRLDPSVCPGEFGSTLGAKAGRRRSVATPMPVFALFAGCPVLSGVYGIASYDAARRMRETGIRLAPGPGRFEIILRSVNPGWSGNREFGECRAIWLGPRQKLHRRGLCALDSRPLARSRHLPFRRGTAGKQMRRNAGSRRRRPTTTSSGLPKQPDNQKPVCRLVEDRFRRF